MNKISLISGCARSGKTTLANALASSEEKSIHLPLDAFFEFLAHPISPVLSDPHQQNTSILKSGARAAEAFFEDGYRVFVKMGLFCLRLCLSYWKNLNLKPLLNI